MKTTYLLIALLVLLAFGVTSAYLIVLAYQRKKYRDKEIDDLLNEQEINSNYIRMQKQEEERQQIAQEIHDGLGSILTTVKLYFTSLDSKIDLVRLENRDRFDKASLLLDKACDEVRRISYDMQTGVLEKAGLSTQLLKLAEAIRNKKKIKLEITLHNFDKCLGASLELNIYKIIQELISNVLKHASATKLNIQLSRFDTLVNILVEDNGIGFRKRIVVGNENAGLQDISNRVSALNGVINIDSAQNRGTIVSIDLPISNFN